MMTLEKIERALTALNPDMFEWLIREVEQHAKRYPAPNRRRLFVTRGSSPFGQSAVHCYVTDNTFSLKNAALLEIRLDSGLSFHEAQVLFVHRLIEVWLFYRDIQVIFQDDPSQFTTVNAAAVRFVEDFPSYTKQLFENLLA